MRSSRDGGVEGGDMEEKWVVRWDWGVYFLRVD